MMTDDCPDPMRRPTRANMFQVGRQRGWHTCPPFVCPPLAGCRRLLRLSRAVSAGPVNTFPPLPDPAGLPVAHHGHAAR